MQTLRWVQLSDDERDGFLGRGGTGVLSVAKAPDQSPVSIPVSYGYDRAETRFYFQLSVPEEQAKAEFFEQPVSFVTYGKTDRGWQSVIATGTLEEITDVSYESTPVQGMWAIDIPRVDIFERPREEITFRDVYLDPETVTGRKEAPTRP